MSRGTYLILLLFVLPMLSKADNPERVVSTADTLAANMAYSKAETLYKSSNSREAIPFLEKAIDSYQNEMGKQHACLIKCYELGALIHIQLHQYKQTETYAEKGVKLMKRNGYGRSHRFVKMSINLSIAKTELKKYVVSEKSLEAASDVLLNIEIEDPTLEAKILFETGIIRKKRGEIEDALNYYLVALDAFKELNDSIGMGSVLYNIGNIEYGKYKHGQARHYYKKAIAYYPKVAHRQLSLALYAISLTYNRERAYELSMEYLKLASTHAQLAFGPTHSFTKKILYRVAQNSNFKGDFKTGILWLKSQPTLDTYSPAQLELGKAYLELNEIDKAEEYTLKSLTNGYATKKDSLYSLLFYAKVLSKKGELERAAQICLENIKNRQKVMRPTGSNIQSAYLGLAKIYAKQKKFEQSFLILDTLLSSPNNMFSVLSNGDTIKSLIWDDVFKFKTKLLFEVQKQDPNERNSQIALATSIKYLKSIEEVRRNAEILGSHASLTNHDHEIIELVLDMLFDQYQVRPDNRLVSKALYQMDHVRDMLWVDIIQNKQAIDLSHNELINVESENSIRKNVAKLDLMSRLNPDSTELQKNLTELKSKLRASQNQSQFAYKKVILDEEQMIQAVNKDDEIVISYFFTTQYMYRIFIHKDQFIFDRAAWGETENTLLSNLVTSISGQSEIDEQSQEILSKILLGGFPLNNQEPIKFYLDGKLYSFPFELLSAEGSEQPIVFDHSISYNTSIKRADYNYQRKIFLWISLRLLLNTKLGRWILPIH